jgi:cephalosporin hydroxylase
MLEESKRPLSGFCEKNIMVYLDSNYSCAHVLAELRAYASLVSIGSYCMVGDTVVEELPGATTSGRSWERINNPKTALREYLKENNDFLSATTIDSKLIITGS